jgi:hypothetical protein
MALQRAQRLRPGDAVHGQPMLGLEGADRAASLWTEDAVGRNSERALKSLDRRASASHSEERAAPVGASLAGEGCPGLGTDDPVHQETVSLLERTDGRACPRPEDPVGVDTESTLDLGDRRATASEA